MVRMEHDGIEQTIEVAASAVPTHERSRWRVVKDDQPGSEETAPAGDRRWPEGGEG